MTVNIPTNVARHIRSGLVVTDAGASRTSAETRMHFAEARLVKAEQAHVADDHEAAAMWAESAVMIAFEAWLMHCHLKLATSERSHAAMADFVGWLGQRAGVDVNVWELHELVESRGRIMYQPWDSTMTGARAAKALSLARIAVGVLAAFPPLQP